MVRRTMCALGLCTQSRFNKGLAMNVDHESIDYYGGPVRPERSNMTRRPSQAECDQETAVRDAVEHCSTLTDRREK
jgi:hypothetical protein